MKCFVLVTYHRGCICSHDFVTSFFGAYNAHFFLKYDLSDPLISHIFILTCPGAEIHLSITTIYVNYNTDKFHNAFVHLYWLLHISIVSYITPSFMAKFSPYIHWMKFWYYHMYYLHSEQSLLKMWIKVHLKIWIIASIISIFIIILTSTAFYVERTVETKCLWLVFHVKLFLQSFIIITFCHNIIDVRKKYCLLNSLHFFSN